MTFRAKLIAVGTAAAALFAVLVMLASSIIVMGNGALDDQQRSDCVSPTIPLTPGALPAGDLAEQQVSNAKLIDKTAADLGLSGRASYLAIVTAMGESDLININHGDAHRGVTNPDGTPTTSLGLFQQQTSMGWGTAAQVTNPTYATQSFLLGARHDGKGGLVAVKGWETRPATDVIHEVQRNSDPSHYARYEARALAIIQKAGIDTTRPATTDGTKYSANADNAPDPATGPIQPTGCNQGATAALVSNIALTSGPCPAGPASNGVTCDAAIQFMSQQMESGSRDWRRWCLRLVSEAYGSVYAGIPTAYQGGLLMQQRGLMQPPTTDYKAIPRGAVIWYDGNATGNAAGHVAVSLGNGMAISNDVPVTDGRVGVVPISYFETNWGQRFMGWSAPQR